MLEFLVSDGKECLSAGVLIASFLLIGVESDGTI